MLTNPKFEGTTTVGTSVQQLSRWLLVHRWTVAKLAHRMELSVQAVFTWLDGKNHPSPKNQVKLKEITGIEWVNELPQETRGTTLATAEGSLGSPTENFEVLNELKRVTARVEEIDRVVSVNAKMLIRLLSAHDPPVYEEEDLAAAIQLAVEALRPLPAIGNGSNGGGA